MFFSNSQKTKVSSCFFVWIPTIFSTVIFILLQGCASNTISSKYLSNERLAQIKFNAQNIVHEINNRRNIFNNSMSPQKKLNSAHLIVSPEKALTQVDSLLAEVEQLPVTSLEMMSPSGIYADLRTLQYLLITDFITHTYLIVEVIGAIEPENSSNNAMRNYAARKASLISNYTSPKKYKIIDSYIELNSELKGVRFLSNQRSNLDKQRRQLLSLVARLEKLSSGSTARYLAHDPKSQQKPKLNDTVKVSTRTVKSSIVSDEADFSKQALSSLRELLSEASGRLRDRTFQIKTKGLSNADYKKAEAIGSSLVNRLGGRVTDRRNNFYLHIDRVGFEGSLSNWKDTYSVVLGEFDEKHRKKVLISYVGSVSCGSKDIVKSRSFSGNETVKIDGRSYLVHCRLRSNTIVELLNRMAINAF